MKTLTVTALVVALMTIGAFGYPSHTSAEEDKNIEQMITTAKTPADHQTIADFYRNESVAFRKEADQHAQLAQKLAAEAGGQAPWASHHYERAEHCRKLADSLGQAAQEAQALAKIHESMAQFSAEEKP